MTRQEVINELTDIRAAIDADGELVAEDSLDALATKLMEEGSTDISEVELDTLNAMIYDSFVDPETICVELINMLMSTVSTVEEDIDPFIDDIWNDLSDEEVAALTSDDGINWAEYPDHEFQEEVDDKSKDTEKLTEEKNLSIDSIEGRVQAYQDEIKAISDMTKDGVEDDLISVVTEIYEDGNTSLDYRDEKEVLSWIKKNSKLSAEEFFKKLVDQMNDLINRLQKSKTEALTEEDKAYEYQCSECGHTAMLTDKEYDGMCPNCKDHHGAWSKIEEDLTEAHYGKDSIIAGDIPGKTNGFVELISMRFHNMGFDEGDHPLFPGEAEQMWNPFGNDSVVMYGPSEEFFNPIVAYIESEVGREDSAWYNRDYEVCKVEDRYNKEGPWALCIEARDYDQGEPDFIPMTIKAEYARRRKMRRANDKVPA
ncbi:MAG: hypothetical protein J6A25_07835 [Lachnospiraceae bacterium]|nr:hypothetical protein [Lachnospiraceae bacterium]MBO5425409.1 hypothetical protein [Lachnospiraceae bacterium]